MFSFVGSYFVYGHYISSCMLLCGYRFLGFIVRVRCMLVFVVCRIMLLIDSHLSVLNMCRCRSKNPLFPFDAKIKELYFEYLEAAEEYEESTGKKLKLASFEDFCHDVDPLCLESLK